MPSTKLTTEQVAQQLATIPGWTARDGALHRELEFADFVEAFGFMASVALVAERMNHHPNWYNVYNTVRIELSTHDAGGITANDFALATAMNRLAAGRTQ